MQIRVGQGWDSHALAADRRLVIGGVEIPHTRGLAGHSDGDVLAHAICDALLGALSLGDIGTHFPAGDAQWRDASSLLFLHQARELGAGGGWRIGNVDSTVILAAPQLGPYRHSMRAALAAALGIAAAQVSVKAKTPEGLPGGADVAMAHAVVLLTKD